METLLFWIILKLNFFCFGKVEDSVLEAKGNTDLIVHKKWDFCFVRETNDYRVDQKLCGGCVQKFNSVLP